ncbi:MAG: histidine kinase [Azospirillum sp.]|nr:histidine kinase [Azospirillum sp.]
MGRIVALFFAVAVFGWISLGTAADRGSPEEAKAMAETAAAFLKAEGPEKAFKVFMEKGGPFHDRDLYVFVQNRQATMVAHGTNPALVGKDMTNLRDVDGKLFNKAMMETKDAGWVEYKWLNPVSKAFEPKVSYVIWAGDYLVGVGAYK